MKTVLYFRSYSNFNASRKLAGVMRAAHEFGWNVQTIDTGRETTDETVSKLLELWHPVGIINESAAGTADLPLSTYGKTPVVFIDRNPQTYGRKCSCVFNDSSANVRMAAQELLSLNPACYAYVPWHEPLFWCRERESAFRDLLRLHGKSLVRFPGKRDTGTDSYSIDELGAWLNRIPHPAGVLAANDYTGRQVIAAASRVGLSVPGDVAVVGIDDEEIICENTQPTLTSIRPDFEALGEESARLLQKIILRQVREPTSVQVGPVKIVRRESTLRLHTSDLLVSQAVDLIRRKACEGLTAQDVLALFPVSRRQAEIRFRRAVGRSILDEIQRVRIEKAKSLLLSREQPNLTAIANFCGYATSSALYKTFTKETGLSPLSWRLREKRQWR